MKQPKPFLTTTEAAKLIGFSAQTIREEIQAGRIPAIQGQSKLRIPTTEFLRYVERHCTGGRVRLEDDQLVFEVPVEATAIA